ncbi:MAG: type II toxin-antitoxin system VapC family toxin [Lachnospiraceae bacterium]|nr:type II toxin-antitoxin system VapC family toxin [Lachnospiraceae bacterium]
MYISDIVLNEISGCIQEKLDILLGYLKQVQYHLIYTDEDTVELAEKFIDFGTVA